MQLGQSIGKRIREERLAKKWSQLQLAEKVFTSTDYISHIENGRKCPSLEMLIQIASSLGVTIDTLLNGQQAKNCAVLNNEISEILSDCSVYERRVLLDLLKQTKQILRDNYDLLNPKRHDTRISY